MSENPALRLAARLHAAHQHVFALARRYLAGDALPLLARLALAGVFWRSLLTKVETVKLFTWTELINNFPVEHARMRLPDFPLTLRPAALHQFETDFVLPLVPPGIAVWVATLAEFVLPILLLLGLATRLSALALIGMTLVIQIFVFPDAWWPTHALWIVIAGYIALNGPGRASVDHWAGPVFAR